MKASEARNKSQAVNLNESEGQLFKVRNAISQAVSKGEYYCHIYFSPNYDVSKKLKEEGYEVSNVWSRNETLYVIKW